jgi:hypothetical protein
MRYYIAVVNPDLHLKEWNKLKTNLIICGYSYIVYFDCELDRLELNEVNKDVFEEMHYNVN